MGQPSTNNRRVEKSYSGDLMAKGMANENILMDWLRSEAKEVIDFREFRLAQRLDTDCGIESLDGDIQLAELKSDKWLKPDGNLLFECFRINHFVEDSWHYLGWGWRSPSQRLIIRNPKTGYTLVLRFSALRHRIGRIISDRGKDFKSSIDIVETDKQKTTFNFLIPLKELPNLYKEYWVFENEGQKRRQYTQGKLWL